MKKFLSNIFLTALVFTCLNIGQNAYCQGASPLTNHISRIETSLWGFDYTNDEDEKRLERLEKAVFGEVNTKDTLEKRLEKISLAIGYETQKEAQSTAGELMQEEVEGVSYPQIDQLELNLFSKTYDKENIYKRLERLEKKIFGAVQEGDLSARTDKLKGYLAIDTTPKSQGTYYDQNIPYRGYDPYANTYGSDLTIQISGLEQSLFGKTFSQDPMELRLNRLERKIFQRDFSTDDNSLRLQRLQAAASAKKTAKYYDMNKAQKFTSTGLQIGTLILMILAMIL